MLNGINNTIRKLVLDGLYLYGPEGPAVGPPLNKEGHEEEYFKLRQDERREFMDDLERLFPLDKTTFCSIACGFGGEEYLLKDKLKKLVLIEPDSVCSRFIKTKFGDKASLFSGYMQSFDAQEKYDIIYASSPSNWMLSSPVDAIPGYFIDFLIRYLEPTGIFIARLYGGYYLQPIIENAYFVKLLQKKLHSNRFTLLQYVLHEGGAFLVAARYGAPPELAQLVFPSENGVYYVKAGKFLRSREPIDWKKKGVTILKLLFLIPAKITFDTAKILRQSYRHVLFNVRL
jgi:hypothetical protein